MLFGRHINRYYLKYAPQLIFGIFALLLVDYMQLVVPELYRTVVNGIGTGSVTIDGETVPFTMTVLLDHVCLPLIFVILLMVFGRFLWRVCFFGVAVRLETDLRYRMFDRCKDLSQQFYEKNKVGALMSLFTNDIDTIQDCFSWGVLMFCDAIALGALAFMKMAQMDLVLTLLSMIPMAILLFGGFVLSKYLMLKWDKRQEAYSTLSDFSQESFAGIAVIKAFVKQSKELLAFRKLNKENEDRNVEYTRLSVLLNVSVTLLVESVICVILGYGGYLVWCGKFDAGQLVEFIGYFTAIVWPIMAVSQLIEMTSRGKASLDRVGELLDRSVDVSDEEGVSEPAHMDASIEFKHLSFTYPYSEREVLTDVSFRIEAGENVGIVGKTGSGKTTVVDLILRTYNVSRGTLFVGGHDVCDIPIRTVREHAAYVPQDGFLFSDTIERNIAFATDGGDHADVENAAISADVHDNIAEFPLGYETVLGERGVTVSGGQKQRISIARALMKNADILILDDAVSAVDVKTEKAILSRLHELRKGKTTILIAHRISTIEGMDKIIYIENGKIEAIGTHESLLQTNESYRAMVELQKLNEREKAESEGRHHA